jgi:hypothetical protein
MPRHLALLGFIVGLSIATWKLFQQFTSVPEKQSTPLAKLGKRQPDNAPTERVRSKDREYITFSKQGEPEESNEDPYVTAESNPDNEEASPPPQQPLVVASTEDIQRVEESLSKINLYDWFDFQDRLQEFKGMDPQILGSSLTQIFKATQPSDGGKRNLVVEVAKGLNSPYTYPIWSDIIERETERFEEEASERKKDSHINMVDRMITAEQHIALRELSQIALQSPEARSLLWRVVTGQVPTASRLDTRRRAFVVLREVNPSITIRLGAYLTMDDPLREQIIQLIEN